MRKTTIQISVLIVCMSLLTWLSVQDVQAAMLAAPEPTESGKPESKEESKKLNGLHLELGFQLSLSNSYKVGNVNTWYGEVSRYHDPVKSEATGFNQFDLRLMGGDIKQPFRFGVGGSYYMGSAQALTGATYEYGSNTSFGVKPSIVFLSLPIQVQVGNETGLYLTLEPAMGLSMLTGYFDFKKNHTSLESGTQVGYQLAGGLDFYFKPFLIFARAGDRWIKADVTFKDSSGKLKQYRNCSARLSDSLA